ncbi:DNA-binding response regulator [Anaerocolumna cellulosilytica]|uniref:Stage 0 sporulation protein A homolog n=1 Tax=Anaerocolumna cellulosilytica TaxID=433286 RepID=A0A6S6R576_9FIRM|nr:response regulator transcription factor [Anaerocolumna cellulosilytica]MBB5194805.1 two-component system response regulator RegX3 [Anaerocolumna cellulosilytica]BCJ94231.1 DNA-binding response regulator [Anaerocolumna cellulosilytica]
MNFNCLIIDDEETIGQTTSEYFNMFDVTCEYVTSYGAAIDFLSEHQVSLLLLDINLGEHSGFELCKKIRKTTNIPILFISARTSDDDILTALNIGGDDYITKPYSLNILLAKVKAILKRCESNLIPVKTSPCEQIQIDYNYRQIMVNQVPIKLKNMEFKVLSYLMEHTNTVISKEELFQNIWQSRFIEDGTLSVHIRRLRQLIEEDPDNPRFIKTIWGVGYVFEVKE